MTDTWTVFDKFIQGQVNGAHAVDLDTDTLKVMIVTSTFTPAVATNEFKSDVTNEVSGTNYSAGGPTLATATVSLASDIVSFNGADITISQSAAGFSNGRTVILYKSTGVDSTSPLIAYATHASDFGNVAGDLVLQINANKIFTISHSP